MIGGRVVLSRRSQCHHQSYRNEEPGSEPNGLQRPHFLHFDFLDVGEGITKPSNGALVRQRDCTFERFCMQRQDTVVGTLAVCRV